MRITKRLQRSFSRLCVIESFCREALSRVILRFSGVGHGVGSDAGTGCCASISYIFGLALANELELLLEHMLWNFIY